VFKILTLLRTLDWLQMRVLLVNMKVFKEGVFQALEEGQQGTVNDRS
jgi:hypothetical protein